jgi:hypothetical protein
MIMMVVMMIVVVMLMDGVMVRRQLAYGNYAGSNMAVQDARSDECNQNPGQQLQPAS